MAWPLVRSRLEASPHAWNLGWGMESPTAWTIQGASVPIRFQPSFLQDLRRSVRLTVKQGLDWTIHRCVIAKGGKRLRFHQAIWQGALVQAANGGHALCPHCGAANTLEHLLWECSQSSPRLRAMRDLYPEPCLWLRGLVPARLVQMPLLSTEEVREGEWPTGPRPEDLFVGTDASGGRHSSDPRLRAVGWAVVLGRRTSQGVGIMATVMSFPDLPRSWTGRSM